MVTLGRRGALYLDRTQLIDVAPFAVDAVDATAAGDAFCGALVAALARGLPMAASLERASAAGALACTVAGASPSLPAAAAVDALLSARGPAPAGESQARIRPVARKSSRSPSS